MSASHQSPPSPRMRAMAVRMARQAGIEISDAHQQLELIAIEHAGSFDAGRGASRETYYLRKLDSWIKQQRAGMRFGVALDDDESAVEAVESAISAARAGASVADWRMHSDVDVNERVGVLPDHLRGFAQRFVAGLSCKEVAAELGLTDRRAQQAVAEIVAFFGNNNSTQPSLF